MLSWGDAGLTLRSENMRWFVVLLLAYITFAQTPENAFIVVIDGLRNNEGFEVESLYLPHLWNDLKPLGTINTRFYNRGWTATTAGHTTILSGVRQIILNNGGNEQEIRSYDPLMFECYRKFLGAPESACGVIVGKWGNCGSICNFSLEPAFGINYRGFQIRDSIGGTADSICSKLVNRVMDSLHPRLVLVNLGDVDHFGHQGEYAGYLQAIRIADSIVYEFYKHIQAIPPYNDTFYRNKTIFIVTSDHGRNDDAHGSFKGHGEWDHGCRHIIFYAFGPGVAVGRTVDQISRDQIDIAPTISRLLGFPMPFAEGEVMSEIFADGFQPVPVVPTNGAALFHLNISHTPGFSRDPDLCRDSRGNLHLVWADKTPGKWAVLYSRSNDEGVTWSEPITLFDYPATDSQMWFCRIAAADSVLVGAIGWGKRVNYIDSIEPRRMDTTFLWYPWLASSIDAGSNWQTQSLFDSSMGSNYPAVAVSPNRFAVAWWQCGKFSWEATNQGINFNQRVPNGIWDTIAVNLTTRKAIHLALVDAHSAYHLVASEFRGEDWDIGYHISLDGINWSTEWVVSDPDGTPVYDYDPELAVDDSGMVHVVWARKENSGGVWRVMYGRRHPVTATWDTSCLVQSGADAWQPHISCKGDTLAVVWVDYRLGSSEIYGMFSSDRGLTWSASLPITAVGTLSQHPRLCPLEAGFFAVWQSYLGNNWEILGERFPLQQAIAERVSSPGCMITKATVVCNSAPLTSLAPARLFDISGRERLKLKTGENDIRGIPSGIYFVTSESMPATKVIIKN